MTGAGRPRASGFGVELSRLLLEEGVSLQELARRTGLHKSALQRYTVGARAPTDETLELIAAALEREPEQLLEWRRRRVVESLHEDPRLVSALYSRLSGGRPRE